MPRPVTLVLFAAALAATGGFAFLAVDRARAPQSFAAPGLESPADAKTLSDESFTVVPVVLAGVYDAFGRTEEGAIYDGLAEVAAGDALEALYLARLGEMRDGGLEADQQIHEMELLSLVSRSADDLVRVEARWRVRGTVGHAEHLHVRGNIYAAELVLAPVTGAWRLTGFDLTDVDRTGAGEMQARVDGPWSGTGAESN